AQKRHLRALEPSEIAAADDDAARRRLELLQQEADHRRLPGARRADDEDELTLLDHEAHVLERLHPEVVLLRDGLEHDHRPRARRERRLLAFDWAGECGGFGGHVFTGSKESGCGSAPAGVAEPGSLTKRAAYTTFPAAFANNHARMNPSTSPSRTPCALPTS